MAALDELEEEQIRIGGTARQDTEEDENVVFEGTGSFKKLTSETLKMSPKVLRKA